MITVRISRLPGLALKQALLFLLCMHVSIAFGAPMTDAEIKEKAFNDLASASGWWIEDGLREYYLVNQKKELIQKKVRDTWAVSSHSGPEVDTEWSIAWYVIKAAGIYNEIILLQRSELDQVYEYWVIKTSGKSWAKVEKACQFIITKADSKASAREIIRESNRFFSSYDEAGVSFLLDLEDLALVYELTPWSFPSCYEEGSDLIGYKIKVDENGIFTRKKISWLERMFSR